MKQCEIKVVHRQLEKWMEINECSAEVRKAAGIVVCGLVERAENRIEALGYFKQQVDALERAWRR